MARLVAQQSFVRPRRNKTNFAFGNIVEQIICHVLMLRIRTPDLEFKHGWRWSCLYFDGDKKCQLGLLTISTLHDKFWTSSLIHYNSRKERLRIRLRFQPPFARFQQPLQAPLDSWSLEWRSKSWTYSSFQDYFFSLKLWQEFIAIFEIRFLDENKRKLFLAGFLHLFTFLT